MLLLEKTCKLFFTAVVDIILAFLLALARTKLMPDFLTNIYIFKISFNWTVSSEKRSRLKTQLVESSNNV